MRSMAATALGALFLVSGFAARAARADDPTPNDREVPATITVRVKAAKDGSVLDVEFQTHSRGTVTRTPTGLARLFSERIPGQPEVRVDWEKVTVEGLTKLRKDQGLGEGTAVSVSPDDGLKFGPALAVVACCRKAGFKRVEFGTGDQGKVVIVLAEDGKVTVDGKAAALGGVMPLLADKAKAVGGADKVEVVIRAHPDLPFSAVSRLLRDLKEGGFKGVEVASQQE